MNKLSCLLALLLSLQLLGFSQTPATKDDLNEVNSKITKLNENIEKLTNKTVSFGLSLGYRYLTQNSRSNYEQASISPIDNTLQLSTVNDGSFLLSTSVIFNPKLNTKSISDQINVQIFSFILENNEKSLKVSELDLTSQLLLSDVIEEKRVSLKKNIDEVNVGDLQLSKQNSQNLDFSSVLVYNFMYDLTSKIKATTDNDEKAKLKRLRRKIRRMLFSKVLINYGFDRISLNANLNLIEFSTAQQELTFNRTIDGGLGISYMINPNLYVGINWESFRSRQLHDYLKERVGQQIIYNGNVISSSKDLDITNDDFFINKNLNGISFKIIVPL